MVKTADDDGLGRAWSVSAHEEELTSEEVRRCDRAIFSAMHGVV